MVTLIAVLAFSLTRAHDSKKTLQRLRLVLWAGTPFPHLVRPKNQLVRSRARAGSGKDLATLDSPDQGAFGIPVDRSHADSSKMAFEIKSLKRRRTAAN